MAFNSLPLVMFTTAFEDAFEDILLAYWTDGHFDYGVPYWVYGWISTEIAKKSLGQFSECLVREYFAHLKQRYNDFLFLLQQSWYSWGCETNKATVSILKSNWKKFSSMYPFVIRYRNRGERLYSTLAHVFRCDEIVIHPSSVQATEEDTTETDVASTDSSPFPPTEWSSNEYQFRYFAPPPGPQGFMHALPQLSHGIKGGLPSSSNNNSSINC